MRKFILPAAVLLTAACGGSSADPVEYRETTLEPKSVVFGHVVQGGEERLFVALSDESDYCASYDGLGCIPRPQTGRTLTFFLDAQEERAFNVGSDARARYLDYTERQSSVRDEATSGRITIERLEAEQSLEATYDVTLPAGDINGEFSAAHCRHIREYSLRCPDQAL